jgi:hypothetical protein
MNYRPHLSPNLPLEIIFSSMQPENIVEYIGSIKVLSFISKTHLYIWKRKGIRDSKLCVIAASPITFLSVHGWRPEINEWSLELRILWSIVIFNICWKYSHLYFSSKSKLWGWRGDFHRSKMLPNSVNCKILRLNLRSNLGPIGLNSH